MLNTSQTMANYGVYSFFLRHIHEQLNLFVSPFFGLANNVKLSFFVYSMKKSAKNVVLTDFTRYPVCGMFLFFSFSFSCPFSCYKALSHLHVLHLILSFVQNLVEEGV